MADNKEETFIQLRERLHKSGEWDKIMRLLVQQLNERGWVDIMRDQSKERARTMAPLNFAELMTEMHPQALESIPPEIKKEIMTSLTAFFKRELQ